MMRALRVVTTFAAISVIAGCAVSDESSEERTDELQELYQNVISFEEGSYKLYTIPDAEVNPTCDAHTLIELVIDDAPQVTLEERVVGNCAEASRVDPKRRTYKMKAVELANGRRVYTEWRAAGDTSPPRVTIVDSRFYTGNEPVHAKLVVEETRQGATTQLFGNQEACCQKAPVWPVDATKYEMVLAGGGFESPATFDASCKAADSRYTVDITKGEIAWDRCVPIGAGLQLESGKKQLPQSHLLVLEYQAKRARRTSDEACTSHTPETVKPFISFTIWSQSQGAKSFADSKLACKGGPFAYVDRIGPLRTVTEEISGAFR